MFSVLVVGLVSVVVALSATVTARLVVWLRTINIHNWHTIDHNWTSVGRIACIIVRLPRAISLSLNLNWHALAIITLYNWCKLLLARLSLQHHRRLLQLFLLSLLVHFVVPQTLVGPRKSLWTVLASIRLLAGMNSKVSAHVVGAREEPAAALVWAGKGFFASVRSHVSFKFVLAVEGLVALVAVGEDKLASEFLFLGLFSSFGLGSGLRGLAFYHFWAGR